MPRKIKDLAVKTGSYTDRNGETKNRYKNVDSILEMDDGGKMLLLDRCFNPAGVPHKDGSDQIIISVFDTKERDGNGSSSPPPAASKPAPANGGVDFSDDIPF